jgi:hypothetical protein
MITATDPQFHLYPYGTHNPNDGSKIGGNMPTAYGALQAFAEHPNSLLAYVEGGPYATMMVYIDRPFVYGTNLQTDFDITVGGDSANLELIETDVIVTDPNGWTYNASMQNFQGQLQIVNAAGQWENIPKATPGMLMPGSHHITHNMTWNPTTHTYTVTQITIDKTTFVVPVALQNVAGTQKGWAPSAVFQLQLTLLSTVTNATSSVIIDNAQYSWS